MAESHVISALVEKRSQLSGSIDYHQKQIKQIKVDMCAIDGAIKVFNPEYDLRGIKSKQHRSKNQFFRHGECSTLLMDIIRDAQDRISTIEVVEEAARIKKLNLVVEEQKAFTASIFTVLKRLQGNEIIKEVDRIGKVIVWQIA